MLALGELLGGAAESLRQNPALYLGSLIVSGLGALAFVAQYLVVLRGRSGGDRVEGRGRALAFLAFGSAFMVCGRWPAWLLAEQNADESTAVSAAITLAKDPRFWKAVDTGTHGPLVATPLLLVRLLGLRLDHASARLLGMILLVVAIGLCYRVGSRWFGQLPAKLAVLPIYGFLAFTTQGDFLSYNGEHPILLLSALGAWLFDRSWRDEGKLPARWALAAGFVTGCLPLVKIQAAPLGVAMGLIGLVTQLRRNDAARRLRVVATIGGAVIPYLVLLLYLVVTSAIPDFIQGYLVYNFKYSGRNGSTFEAFKAGWRWFGAMRGWEPFADPLFLSIGLLVLGLAVPALWRRARRPELAIALVITATALFMVWRPGNAFHHYLLLLVLPLVLLAAALLRGWLDLDGRLGAALTIAFTLFTFVLPATRTLSERRAPLYLAVAPLFGHQLLPEMKKYARPGERLFVWGWMSRFYVWTGMIQGVRYGDLWQLAQPLEPFYKANILADFDRAPVPLFLDAVAPQSFGIRDRQSQGHEIFPELAKRIAAAYELVVEQDGLRLYVSKARLAEARAATAGAPR